MAGYSVNIVIWSFIHIFVFMKLVDSETCPANNIRLSNASFGRVEVCHNGEWGTVCDDEWDLKDGNIVCQQLGYPTALGVFHSGYYGPGSGPVLMDNVRCNGSEKRLDECPFKGWGITDCTHNSDAGVECKEAVITNPKELDGRISDGSYKTGRIELYYNSNWLPVCDPFWSKEQGSVFCHQLAFPSLVNTFPSSAYGGSNEAHALKGIKCTGFESKISECNISSLEIVSNANGCDKAAVICSESPSPAVTVRLVDGFTEWDGRVEILNEKTWGAVCGDGWTLMNADVVCHQLGFQRAAKNSSVVLSVAPADTTWLSGVECKGGEGSLTDCHHNGLGVGGDCGGTYAQVVCADVSKPFSVRLVGGSSNNEGRVEILFGDSWGTVCDDQWDLTDANVVCKQLGYDLASEAVVKLSGESLPRFKGGTGMIWMDDVGCFGNESKLADCQFSGWSQHNCDHTEDAGVVCINVDSPTLAPPAIKLRLVNGTDKFSGRVEVQYSGVWGSVCDDGWDITDANTVCQELIFGDAVDVYREAHYGEGTGPIWLDEVSCSPGSTSLSGCGHNGFNNTDCSHSEDAGVSCQGPECKLRLSDGSYEWNWDGTVYVRIRGEWRGVCQESFDMKDARVTCRQMGYEDALDFRGHEGVGSDKYWLSNLDCSGDEERLCECPSNGIGQENCTGYMGVGVICLNSEPFDVRLAGGRVPWEGRVEISVNDVWGRPCLQQWEKKQEMNSKVLCEQLGYHLEPEVVPRKLDYGKGFGPFWLDDFACSGNEGSIFNCYWKKYIQSDCNSGENAVVFCDPGDKIFSHSVNPIRLVNGSTPYEGKLEVLYKGAWGTVCGDNWGFPDSHVVCRQLGFGPALNYFTTGYDGRGLILLDEVGCSGSEQFLTQCSHHGWGEHNCFHEKDIAVNCSILESEVLPVVLTNGSTSVEGIVEVFYGGVSGLVCGENWDLTDADVVCRQLGYSGAQSTSAHLHTELKTGAKWYWIGDVECFGNETRLYDCPSSELGESNCSSGTVAMATCGNYADGSVRLRGGPSNSEGRLEIFFKNQWGSVCDHGLGSKTAEVACKELGFTRPIRTTDGSKYDRTGDGDTPVWIDKVQCKGNENRLRDCPHGPLGTHLCTQEHDVGLICTDDPYYPVRLVNPAGPEESQIEGCVQFYHSNTWGSLCNDDGIITSMTTANVICRTLGFEGAVDSEPVSCSGYPSASYSSLPVWLSNISCSGNEVSISECSHSDYGLHSCRNHDNDVAVSCKVSDFTKPPIRLAGGRSSSEGRIEVFYSGIWGTVCSDHFDSNDAFVVCRQAGFPGVNEIVDVTVFGSGDRVLVDDLECSGTETNLNYCSKSHWGEHDCDIPSDVGVICSNWHPDREGTVRLVGGSDSSLGRLEVYQNSYWGAVCNKDWSIKESNVVCRELGFSSAVHTADYQSFGQGGGPIQLGSISCTGNESLLNECVNSTNVNMCTHKDDVGIVCEKPDSNGCSDLSLRLRGGLNELSGLLEICYKGHWGTVCNDGSFNTSAVNVVCGQLGHASDGGSVLSGTVYGQGTGVIWLSQVECEGEETSIDKCSHLEFGSLSAACYGHSQDINIQCQSLTTYMIKLSEGSKGRVEVFYSGKWGAVCGLMWDQYDADVVCRELGYLRATRPSTGSEFGTSWGPIWMENVACHGTESSLQYCAHNGWGLTECSHENEAGAICTNSPVPSNPSAKVRIIGATPSEGRVEVLYEGKWGTVCYDGWDFLDALVVCKQAGFASVDSIRLSTYADGMVADSFPIWLSNLKCSGTESNIALCGSRGWGSHDCSHDQDAAVVCSYDNIALQPIDIWLSKDEDSVEGQGRVQVKFNGIWGRVCSSSWDIRDADVVCRQLNYLGARRLKVYTKPSSPVLDQVWMDNVHCTGLESDLSNCEFDGWGHGDTSCHDAGVECEIFNSGYLSGNYELRLVGGASNKEGRVEVFYNGIWGTVCDTNFSIIQVGVVCRQLGFSSAKALYKGSWFGKGEGVVLMDEVVCEGEESRLADCSFRGWGFVNQYCTLHNRDVGVVCEGMAVPLVSVRLVNNSTSHEGLVEVYYAGRWGLICGNSWNDFDAKVVCQQLGMKGSFPKATLLTVDSSQNLVWLDNVQCNGSEPSVYQCSSNGWAVHSCLIADAKFAGVSCQYKEPPQFSLRLVGGSSRYEGRLQAFFNGKWGAVCGHDWDFSDARVACRQLGFGDAILSVTSNKYGSARDEEVHVLDNVMCNGNEPGLQYCDNSGFGVHVCSRDNVAGVVCTDTRHPPTVSVRLNPSSGPTSGLVQVLYNNTWGTVCNDGWDQADADVVCHQLGYESALSFTSQTQFSVSGPIWVSRLDCQGSEDAISDCFMETSWGDNSCNHEDDVSVTCHSTKTAEFPLRLVGGPSTNSGRVQVLINGTWGRLCDEKFTTADGNVVCKQMKYMGIMQVLTGTEYSEPLPDEPVLITGINCFGNESRLNDCGSVMTVGKGDVCEGDFSVICEEQLSVQPTNNAVRLVSNGISQHQGRVEIFINGSWGWVCDDQWEDTDASVVCRQVGFAGPAKGYQEAKFGESFADNNALDEVKCTGKESQLIECASTTTHCSNGEEASVVCSDITLDSIKVRLSGGGNLRGLVEVLYGSQWRYVCADHWTRAEADVTCRQLGFRGVTTINGTEFDVSTTTVHHLLGTVHCQGNEERLQDCYVANWDLESCPDETEYTGVECEFAEWAVQLADGSGSFEGRVEVLMNGIWGTVCDNGWSLPEADVVCRELGYARANLVRKGAWFGEGDPQSPILFHAVSCTGDEESLQFCNYQSKGECTHQQDVSVVCSTDITVNNTVLCSEGSVRLVDGKKEGDGRVEVCLDGNWVRVCQGKWDFRETAVVCRQLGFPIEGALSVSPIAHSYPPRHNPLLLDNLDCTGTEASLLDCKHTRLSISTSLCADTQDVTVQCPLAVSLPLNIRLLGSSSDSWAGYVQVDMNSNGRLWGSVCGKGWSLEDASVVCRQLKYSHAIGYTIEPIFGTKPNNSPFVYNDVQCIGLENGLSNCVYSDDTASCDQSHVASAICSNGTTPQTSLRLMDRSSDSEGRLEILFAGVWGVVCFSEWDSEDENVACSQLGFSGAVASSGTSPPPGSITWLSSVKCSGSETSLSHCGNSGWGQEHVCSSVVWLQCITNSSHPISQSKTPLYSVPSVGSNTPRDSIPVSAMATVGVLGGLAVIVMVGLLVAFIVYRRKWHYRTYTLPITPPSERQRIELENLSTERRLGERRGSWSRQGSMYHSTSETHLMSISTLNTRFSPSPTSPASPTNSISSNRKFETFPRHFKAEDPHVSKETLATTHSTEGLIDSS